MKNTLTTVMKELAAAKGIDLNSMFKIERPIYTANKVAKMLDETEYHQSFVVNADVAGYSFTEDTRVERMTIAFFAATASYLSRVKIAKIDEATALIMTDTSGGFMFAAIVEYHENENPDEPGNWSLVLTFEEDDLIALETHKTVKKISYSSSEFFAMMDKVAYDATALQFSHDSSIMEACYLVIQALLQILDREAVEGDTVDIELKDWFIASVEVDEGIKTFGIVPGSIMKEIIKDDTVLDSISDSTF